MRKLNNSLISLFVSNSFPHFPSFYLGYFSLLNTKRNFPQLTTIKEISTQLCIHMYLNCVATVVHKKKKTILEIIKACVHYFTACTVLKSRKFPASSFRWFYMFWDALNTTWPFFENVYLSVCRSVCLYYFVYAVS